MALTQSAVTTVFSGASVINTNSQPVTTFTDVIGIASEGFSYTEWEVEYKSDNATDDLEIHAYGTLSGTTSATNVPEEMPIMSFSLSPKISSGGSGQKTFLISDVANCFLGMVPEPVSTSHHVEVRVSSYKYA